MEPPSNETPINVAEAREMFRCSEVNLETLARTVPGLAGNPFYKLVRHQIASGLEILGDRRTA